MNYISSVFNGLLVGILAAICIIYIFQIKTPYPLWALKTFEKPWIMLLIFVIGVIFLGFNKEAGALLIIISIALFIDKFLFARKLPNKEHDMHNHKDQKKSAPISNKVIGSNKPTETEQHGVSLLPLTNTPPGSFPACYGKYLPIAEVEANDEGLLYFKDKLLEENENFRKSLKPEFGSNNIITADNYASVTEYY